MEKEELYREGAPDGGLFQSEAWQRFQELNGQKIFPYQEGGFLILQTLPLLGRYLYFPRGPVFPGSSRVQEIFQDLVEEVRIGAIRVEPQEERVLQELQKTFGKKLVPAPHDIQPREIFVISLNGTPEDWLTEMKSKTRYNIRLAEKKGVAVRFSREEKDLETFLSLIDSTSARKAIRPHPKNYYRNFFQAFPDEYCFLALAECEGKILSGALLVIHGKTAYYLHGGSSDEKREYMAPFLLHYALMQEAKRRGCTRYDMGGVRLRSKKDEDDTAWDGITRFKLGFASTTETLLFPGTYDIILNQRKYGLYRFFRSLRQVGQDYLKKLQVNEFKS